MSTHIRDIPDYEKGRFYYVGSGGRVMSRAAGRGAKKAREEDMAPIVRKPGMLYFAKNGAIYSAPMKKR